MHGCDGNEVAGNPSNWTERFKLNYWVSSFRASFVISQRTIQSIHSHLRHGMSWHAMECQAYDLIVLIVMDSGVFAVSVCLWCVHHKPFCPFDGFDGSPKATLWRMGVEPKPRNPMKVWMEVMVSCSYSSTPHSECSNFLISIRNSSLRLNVYSITDIHNDTKPNAIYEIISCALANRNSRKWQTV